LGSNWVAPGVPVEVIHRLSAVAIVRISIRGVGRAIRRADRSHRGVSHPGTVPDGGGRHQRLNDCFILLGLECILL